MTAALPTLIAALALSSPAPAAASIRASVGPAECLPVTSLAECSPAGPITPPKKALPHGGGSRSSGSAQPGVAQPGSSPFRFFSPTSFWNSPLPDDAPLDPTSPELVADFNRLVNSERRADRGPSVATSRWSVPIYTVPADQPTVEVEHRNPNGFSPALQEAWNAVPLPPDAQPAAGTDRHLVVWQPSTDTLWEFWRLGKDGGGWWARWGGAMRDVSSNPGIYGPEAWPGATSSWGGSATSLSLAGGLITLEDLERGHIEHALAFASPQVRAGVYSLPAQRTDGASRDAQALPEGARLRLDPDLDLDSLGLPPFTLMVARAVQRYGMILRSQGGIVDFLGQDPTPTGTDPYKGPDGFFEGRQPNELLASFPWSHLQVLKMDLRKPWRVSDRAGPR